MKYYKVEIEFHLVIKEIKLYQDQSLKNTRAQPAVREIFSTCSTWQLKNKLIWCVKGLNGTITPSKPVDLEIPTPPFVYRYDRYLFSVAFAWICV